jgi:hypothetical protein
MRPYPPLTEALRNAVTRGVQVTAVIETLQGAGQRNHCGARRNCPGSRCGDMAALNETATPAGIASGQCTAGMRSCFMRPYEASVSSPDNPATTLKSRYIPIRNGDARHRHRVQR